MMKPKYRQYLPHFRYHEPPVDYSDDSEVEERYVCDKSDKHAATTWHRHCVDLNHHPSSNLPIISYESFVFEKPIGQGGFGKVYRGRYNNLVVAIKEPIYYGQESMESINHALLEEAKLHYQLNHPNVIKMFGISFREEKIYLLMEYAHGRSLRELLTKRTLAPNIIIKFAIQISSAMEYLHGFQPKPIIHRDLKSLNVLLNEPVDDGNWHRKQVKLTDLGLAREFSSSVAMSQCGTYAWMAPESITDSKFSKASDIWSFGVVLWELLTGQIPYRNFSGPAIAFGIGNRRLTLPIPKTCPDELKQILRACWRQNPEYRPSFREIRVQLESSSFNIINIEQFRKMKQNWFTEIENIWASLKEKEKELESREEKAKRKEEETKRKEQEVEKMKLVLLQQSQELKRREIEVVGRELNVLLQQHQKPPESGKAKRRQAKKALLSPGSPQIGYPHNFCHNLTVTPCPDQHAVPILQARALNRTWGPGTKVRPQLPDNLFSHSRSSSKSQDLDQENEVGCKEINKAQRKKRLGSFLRKIFKSSKSSLNQGTNEVSSENDYLVPNMEEPIYLKKAQAGRLRLALNRTYHGQTKHSERQRISVLEHFHRQLSPDCYRSECSEDEDESCLDSSAYFHLAPTPSMAYGSPDTDVSWDRLPPHLSSNSTDCNNNSARHHEWHHNDADTPSHSVSGTSASEQGFDQDLLIEFDKFEQAFQSMNCAS